MAMKEEKRERRDEAWGVGKERNFPILTWENWGFIDESCLIYDTRNTHFKRLYTTKTEWTICPHIEVVDVGIVFMVLYLQAKGKTLTCILASGQDNQEFY